MFEAPEDGYKYLTRFRYGAEGTNVYMDESGLQFKFFVRSHSGRRYSACEFTFYAPNTNGVVETKMRTWMNANGSRNLEHDASHPLSAPSLTQ